MDQTAPDLSQSLLAELERCPACREEFASLRSVLRVADQGMQSALPEEGFWSDYHERLRQSLTRDPTASSPVSPSRNETGALVVLRNLMQRLVTASVPVPVPVAAVLIVLFGLSIGFAAHSRRQPIPGTSTVITKTLEVPVVQERTITRVVYRENPRHSSRETARLERPARNRSLATAGQRPVTEDTPINLVGFKPTSDPKLTIIKGSYRDEK